MQVGENYITDVRNTVVTLDNGSTTDARWLQIKILYQTPKIPLETYLAF
jgi:hypothetical protein